MRNFKLNQEWTSPFIHHKKNTEFSAMYIADLLGYTKDEFLELFDSSNSELHSWFEEIVVPTISLRNFHGGSYEIDGTSEFAFSVENRERIVDILLSEKLNVMLEQTSNGMTIWVDKGRFKQR